MAYAVAQANTTYAQIEQKVRRLTASGSESVLSSADIAQAVNTVYSQDFPYSIKLDQMRAVYTFYTRPYIDRYPLDVNFNQSIRAPVYVEGIQGSFYKDRQQYYSLWTRFPTKFQPISGDGTTQSFTFNVPGPFLSREVVLGGVDISGSAISVSDDGNGNLLYQLPNPIVSQPPFVDGEREPGLYNYNTANPGLNKPTIIGTVDYVTGNFAVDFALAPGGNITPASGTQMTLWVSQYQTGRPTSILFWNNEFTVRPVPKEIHKIEVETFMTPVQFLMSDQSPTLNQWWQYIAFLSAMEILRERQDMEGVENLREGMKRQEALVLERQANEELFVPVPTIFNSVSPPLGGVNGFGYWV